ncbi:3-hydroxyacyl-CoA dehydrogenase NAD-binding domain-containing protein [Frigidibacter sp.]|uniref:3-hydroxyacyl-CoA dehydrogenase NAD-binding domain-containing protein n=1 Tax=Frigidibacter sp. TaxID=2586418 RepID=UPI00273353E6|nr:3-hydroxyacyl-CoA dehydrogenase NAD-binding domain-containing protein [Frigidibacter sp.]MDP3339305.1 3-hydroxyacyl-CoA dehydrogenase NAD-binding domain-containing protein [Frigidibacter sp.]
MSGTVHLQREGAVGILVIDNPPVNAGSSDIRKALLACIAEVEADAALAAGVLIGAGKTFIAGSDLREFDLPLATPQLPAVIVALEGSAKPWVAALRGAALGGGYELALGCDARIAAAGTVVGLPECGLGIIPGAGGTQKLPRLVGKVAAISLITSGRRVGAEEALKRGMIDALALGDLRVEAAALALSLVGRKVRVIERDAPTEDEAAIEAAARKAAASGRGRPHILSAIRHIRAVGSVPAAEGLTAERADFQDLRISAEAKALRHIFFAEREAARGAAPAGLKPAPFASFGILGAGTMGAGIALACLQRGFATTVVDTDPAAIGRARTRIEEEITKSSTAGRLTEAEADAARAGLTLGSDMALLAGSDVIIEAVIEDMTVKQQLFEAIDKVARPDALLATNTSYLDVDAIAAAVADPGRFIGLHFFSPANIMKLLEVVGGTRSTPEALATGLAVARALGKQPVQAGNAFGFIGNRIYAAYRTACEFMLEDGAMPQDVDKAMTEFGFAMGPFAVADLSGLDIAWRMRQQQAPSRDPAARYVHIPDRLCEAGRLGRKTGAGYYSYGAAGIPQPDPQVEAVIVAASAEKGIERRRLTAEEIQRRALAAIVNEAALVVQQGVALRPGDVDVVMVNGYGFPRWTGGPLHWAGTQELAQLAADCAAVAAAAGAGRELADLAAAGILKS